MVLLKYVVPVIITWIIYCFFYFKFKIRFYYLRDLKNLVNYYLVKDKMNNYKEKYENLTRILCDELENKIDIRSEEDAESQYFYGVDQIGNSLMLKFDLDINSIANVTLHLRIQEDAYVFPGKNCNLEVNIPKNRWKVNGLNIEVLEPFTRLRITYNGLLQNVNSGGTVEHVQFNFIFIAACSPHYVPQDIDDLFLANYLSKAELKTSDSRSNDQFGFEQFGVLKGFVKRKTSEEHILNLPTCRSRYKGKNNTFSSSKIFKIVAIDEFGNFFNIILKWYKDGVSQLEYGFAYLSNEKRFPITSIDVPISKNKKKDFRLNTNVKVNGKVYKISFSLKKERTLNSLNNYTFGYQISSIPADCKINNFKGKAIVECWNEYKGTDNFVPVLKLVEKYVKNLPDIYLSDIKEEESQILDLSGGKACSLALLTSLKSSLFSVPSGFVVTVTAFKFHLQENPFLLKSISLLNDICGGKLDEKLEDVCKKTVLHLKNQEISHNLRERIILQLGKYPEEENSAGWAVRSSAIGEDSEEFSAAGQNETFLGCQTEENIINAIQACWASLYTYQSVQYRWQHGLPITTDMAVVVQKMVQTESAGVLFTCHPSTSNPSQMVITSNFGLGETVVSGKSDPDTFVLQRSWDNIMTVDSKILGTKTTILNATEHGLDERTSNVKTFSLTDDQAIELGKIGVYLEEAFGNPRDIEWGFCKEKLYLFQSRPITTLNTWSDFEISHELDSPFLSANFVSTTANIREVIPKAPTVLSQTTSIRSLDRAIQKYVKNNYDPVTSRGLVTYQHNIFLDVSTSIHWHATKKIEVSDVTIDLAIFGHPVLDEKINEITKNRLGLSSTVKKLNEVYSSLPTAWKYKKHLESARNILKNMDLNANSYKELYKKIDSAISDAEELSILHSKTSRSSIFYQICCINILLERNKEILTEHMSDFALILSSCEDVISAEVPKYLQRISEIIMEAELTDQFRSIEPSKGLEWLKINCWKAYELFLDFMDIHGHRSFAEFELMEDTWSDDPSKIIKMIQANVGIERKEKMKMDDDEIIRNLKSPTSFVTRYLIKFLMKKIRVAVGVREHTKCIWIKSFDKIRNAYRRLAEELVVNGLVPAKDLIFHLTHYEIGLILQSRNPVLIQKARRRQKLYNTWLKMKFPEIMFGIPEPEDDSSSIPKVHPTGICKGTPVCRGIVQARACVIRNLEEVHQLKSGDILITYSTDIGWSPYFPILSGVVTELGGLVSHGAVVAREYGLPCIVGVNNVLKYFKTGDMVQLNGNNGELGII